MEYKGKIEGNAGVDPVSDKGLNIHISSVACLLVYSFFTVQSGVLAAEQNN